MVYVPFISESRRRDIRVKRAGGGGRGGGGGGGRSGGSKGGSSGSKGGSSGGSSRSSGSPISGTSSSSGRASAYGSGGGKSITIPSGQPFAGRSAGGGSRGQIYGTSAYGSGYPGTAGYGVANRGFPFYYWPLVWTGAFGIGVAGAAYLDDREYGAPNNSSRPGGVLTVAPFTSGSGNTTVRVVSDNSTVVSLIGAIRSTCGSNLAANSSNPATGPPSSFDPSMNGSLPQPMQVVQYYRASSIALTLDGYNNTVALLSNPDAPPAPLPAGVDGTFLSCLNATIGSAAPLVDAGSLLVPSNFLLIAVTVSALLFSH